MNDSTEKSVYLVSACLMGLCTRYDCNIKPDADSKNFLKGCIRIPVCPEQLGGMATPRPAADITGGDGYDVLNGTAKVCTKNGEDVTVPFIKGAEQVLQIAKSNVIKGICMKAGSPSCAVSGTIGVTAALLKKHGYRLYEF